MIKKLKFKFIFVTMSILTVVLFIVYFSFAITIDYKNLKDAYLTLKNNLEISELTEDLETEQTAETIENNFDKKRIFSIMTPLNNFENGEPIINYDKEFFLEQNILELYEAIFSSDSDKGTINNICFIKIKKETHTMIIGIDRTIENNIVNSMQSVFLLLMIIFWVILFIVVWLLSGFVTKPAREALKKQKQFISDASHELKTPISIISASTQIIKSELKNNKWIDNIESQTKRMSKLVFEMLDLTKLDEIAKIGEKTKFNIGKFVESIALPFESMCFENEKKLHVQVVKNLFVFEDKEALKKVLETIVENAVKHSDENGEVFVNINKVNTKISDKFKGKINSKIEIEVRNTGCKIKEAEKTKIFERFYKSDQSRKNDGSYGLGLAIVKRIAEINKWKLTCDCEYDKWTKFSLTLNLSSQKTVDKV